MTVYFYNVIAEYLEDVQKELILIYIVKSTFLLRPRYDDGLFSMAVLANGLSLVLHTSLLQHESPVCCHCHWGKRNTEQHFPSQYLRTSKYSKQTFSNKKTALTIKVQTKPATTLQHNKSIQQMWGVEYRLCEKQKSRWFTNAPTRSQSCIQQCGEGNAGCYVSSTAYPARLIPAGPAGKESLSPLCQAASPELHQVIPT